jgi:hypothetical protein
MSDAAVEGRTEEGGAERRRRRREALLRSRQSCDFVADSSVRSEAKAALSLEALATTSLRDLFSVFKSRTS